MPPGFLDIAETPSVKAAQSANGVRFRPGGPGGWPHPLTAAEVNFIAARDSFYMATVSETGWPYVQHRGGPPGFLRVIDETTLAFADFRGNRQYISLGNANVNDRVSLILVDYVSRRRLKIYARIVAKDLPAEPRFAAALELPGYRAKPERIFVLHLEAFAWNCSQHIVHRFTEQEIGAALAPVREHIAQLEAEITALRAKLDANIGESNARR